MTGLPTDHLSMVMADSRLRRCARGIAVAWSAAWSSSRVAQAARVNLASWHTWPDARRLRFVSTVLASAGLWYVAGLLLLPQYVTSGLPPALYAAGTVVAAAIAVRAEPVSVAWKASAIRTRVRWLLGVTGD